MSEDNEVALRLGDGILSRIDGSQLRSQTAFRTMSRSQMIPSKHGFSFLPLGRSTLFSFQLYRSSTAHRPQLRRSHRGLRGKAEDKSAQSKPRGHRIVGHNSNLSHNPFQRIS